MTYDIDKLITLTIIFLFVALGVGMGAYIIVSDTRPDSYKRFKLALKESFVLAFQYLLLFLALWLDYKWAWNIYIFTLWALTVLSAFYALIADILPKRDYPFSPWFLMLSDIVIAFVLASTGHFGYAALTLIQMELEQYIISRTQRVQKEGI